jgi:hypothetical protein
VGIGKKYDRLNKAEKDFPWWHPLAAISFNSNANKALEEAQKRFGPSTLHNGSGDAFRHRFWSAMNARDQGTNTARAFGEAHENWIDNPAAEKKMDLHNNEVGFGIGGTLSGFSDRYLAVMCVEAWANGKLVQVDPKGSGDLVYSNAYENRVYK